MHRADMFRGQHSSVLAVRVLLSWAWKRALGLRDARKPAELLFGPPSGRKWHRMAVPLPHRFPPTGLHMTRCSWLSRHREHSSLRAETRRYMRMACL
ncbi:hypothetical protein B0T19DRAFT_428638 [Cercophora scortea]|uniref:Secreted protein n=1 Tax=Cercophora scortea TaxID=314031 RepID=A0AAE0MAF0_9PEZI|nr:hypothetical protein B0T19DRAFT_428638 [Cercophora scortea]